MNEAADVAARFHDFAVRLERRLRAPLPGLAAQLPMAPRPRSPVAPGFSHDQATPAAVLALLFPADDRSPTLVARARPGEPCLLLTRRTEHVATHKREVCLPGGALDPGESAFDAALREAREEVGVARSLVRLLGHLTPVFIPVSGYRMEPFVAACERRPDFQIAAHEVDELIEIPLAHLRDPALRGERPAKRGEIPVAIPYFKIAGGEVWGATAMVLAELCAVLAEIDQAPT